MTVIEARHYGEEIEALKHDPLVIEMAAPLMHDPEAVKRFTSAGKDGFPTHEFMLRANSRYTTLGGTKAQTVGGVARAILALVKEHA